MPYLIQRWDRAREQGSGVGEGEGEVISWVEQLTGNYRCRSFYGVHRGGGGSGVGISWKGGVGVGFAFYLVGGNGGPFTLLVFLAKRHITSIGYLGWGQEFR